MKKESKKVVIEREETIKRSSVPENIVNEFIGVLQIAAKNKGKKIKADIEIDDELEIQIIVLHKERIND